MSESDDYLSSTTSESEKETGQSSSDEIGEAGGLFELYQKRTSWTWLDRLRWWRWRWSNAWDLGIEIWARNYGWHMVIMLVYLWIKLFLNLDWFVCFLRKGARVMNVVPNCSWAKGSTVAAKSYPSIWKISFRWDRCEMYNKPSWLQRAHKWGSASAGLSTAQEQEWKELPISFTGHSKCQKRK